MLKLEIFYHDARQLAESICENKEEVEAGFSCVATFYTVPYSNKVLKAVMIFQDKHLERG